MIRTGYLRWEIEVADQRCSQDAQAREICFLARPSYRRVVIKNDGHTSAADRFVRGEGTYDEVIRILKRGATETTVEIPNVGPLIFRYSESDRRTKLAFWMTKLQREVSAFAHEVVRMASSFPQLVISSAALRAGYTRLVEWEVFRVIEGKSLPVPTIDEEPMRLDAANYRQGVPELVAAELVRDVVAPEDFHEFCQFDRVTVWNGDKIYRIPRRSHALIEVWDAKTLHGYARLCVVFKDPGMPPSDELVMKYLLAKHQADLLWAIGVRFPPPSGQFDPDSKRR